MNIAKLVRRNLSKPFALRVSANTIRARVTSGVARMRGNSLALLAQIHAEVEPELAKRHALDAWIQED